MYILSRTPDPHPGRCKNFRQGSFDSTSYQYKVTRCVRMDLHLDACRFPATEEHWRRIEVFDHYSMGTQPIPERWVEPDI